MNPTGGIRLAIVGPATLLGKEIHTLLSDRAFPMRALELFEETETTSRLGELEGEPFASPPLTPRALEGTDIAFFCQPGPAIRTHAARASADGVRILDLADGLDDSSGAPRVIAGVNDAAITPDQFVFRAASAAAVALATVLLRARRAGRLRWATAMVLTPASERGQPGIDELYNQTLKLLNFQPVPHEVFGEQLAFNLLGQKKGQEGAGLRIAAEVAHALGDASGALAVTTLQVPIFYCTAIALRLEWEAPMTAEALERAIAAGEEVVVAPSRRRPSPVSTAGSDQIHASVTVTPDGGSWIWVVLDNIRRGLAINAIRIAEKLAGLVRTKS